MKSSEISGLIKRRFKIKTTDSDHSNPIAPRIFKTEETETHPTRPHQLWTSDISSIPTQEGFLYLAMRAPLMNESSTLSLKSNWHCFSRS